MAVKVEKKDRSAATMKKLRWLLDFINASIGKRPIASISAQELVIMLRKMEGKGRYETAKRLHSTCSQISRYAIATARAERDVAADLRGALVALRSPAPMQPAACFARSRGTQHKGSAATIATRICAAGRTAPCRMDRLRFQEGAVDDPTAQDQDAAGAYDPTLPPIARHPRNHRARRGL